jgi:hypothetical protein
MNAGELIGNHPMKMLRVMGFSYPELQRTLYFANLAVMKLPLLLSCLFLSVFFAVGQALESPRLQVQVSSRFIDGDDVLSAPRVVTSVDQEAVITVSSDQDGDHFDGVMLSVTPRVSNGKVLLEGFAFAGKGKLGGDDGIKSRAKRALESLKEKGGGIDKIEMRGLFSIGGKPRVSLSVDGGSAFWLQPGLTQRGMKFLRVEGDKDPYAVIETSGRQIRVYLNATKRSEVVPMVAMKGGGGVFLREMLPGKNWIFPLFREDGTTYKVELSAQVVSP